MDSYKTFETERLFLKPTSAEDAELILALFNSPKWIQFIGDRNIRTVEMAKNYILEKITPQLERLGFANYTIIRKSDNIKIGICGLYDREGTEGIDIGFAVLPEFEKNGYVFEAAERIKNAGLHEFGLTIIMGFTTKNNYASQKLLEKLGLVLTGTTKIPKDEKEMLVYALEK